MRRVFLAIIVASFTSCSAKSYSQYAQHAINVHADQMHQTMNWDLWGIGGAWTTDVRTLSLKYYVYDQVDIAGARRLYVLGVESLIKLVNADLEIRPYLRNFPFTYRNTDILLAISRPDLTNYGKGYVSLVFLREKDGCSILNI